MRREPSYDSAASMARPLVTAVAVSGPMVAAEATTVGDSPVITAAAAAVGVGTPNRRASRCTTTMRAVSHRAPTARETSHNDHGVSLTTTRAITAVTP